MLVSIIIYKANVERYFYVENGFRTKNHIRKVINTIIRSIRYNCECRTYYFSIRVFFNDLIVFFINNI